MPVAIVVNFMKKTTQKLSITSPCKKVSKAQNLKRCSTFHRTKQIKIEVYVDMKLKN
jgi:hypothetical protein